MSASSTINETKNEQYSNEKELSSPPLNQPPKGAWRLIRLSLLGLAAIVCTNFLVPQDLNAALNRKLKQSIESKLIGADTLLIGRGLGSLREPMINAVEIHDPKVVAEFLQLIEPDENVQTGEYYEIEQCLCEDDFQVEFRQGNIPLARFGITPFPQIRTSDTPLPGTFIKLTDQSYAALIAWSEQISPPTEK